MSKLSSARAGFFLIVSAAIGLVLLCSSTSVADPVRVTSGVITLTDEPGEVRIAGSGFDVNVAWFPTVLSGTFWFDRCAHFSCSPGSSVDFTATYGFAEGEPQGNAGTVNGINYPSLFAAGTLAFHGPAIAIPSHVDDDESVVLRGPFTFHGSLSVFANEARSGPALFSGELIGRGTATAFGSSQTGMGVRFHDLVYSFESPVPEPSTGVLLIAGAVAAAIGRRRRLS